MNIMVLLLDCAGARLQVELPSMNIPSSNCGKDSLFSLLSEILFTFRFPGRMSPLLFAIDDEEKGAR